MDADDMKDFNGYLRACTNRQIQGVFDKERKAGREDYAELARTEARVRGITLDE